MAQQTTVPTKFTTGTHVFINDSVLNYDDKSGGVLYSIKKNAFDPNGNILTATSSNWDPVWEMPGITRKEEYEYNEQGLLVKFTNYNNIAVDKVEGEPEWSYANSQEHYYTDGVKDSTLSYGVDWETKEQYLNGRTLFVYDDNGSLIKKELYNRWNPANPMALSTVIEYSDFNSFDKFCKKTTKGYHQGEVTYENWEVLEYDANGNNTKVSAYGFDENDMEVKESERTFVYNDKNQMTEETFYKADRFTLEWGPFYRYDFKYDDTFGYATQMEYYVYAIDYQSCAKTNTYKYYWTDLTTTSISNAEQAANSSIKVNAEKISLSYSGKMSGMAVYDAAGRVIKRVSGATTTVDTGGMQPGKMYIVTVNGDNGTYTQKITF